MGPQKTSFMIFRYDSPVRGEYQQIETGQAQKMGDIDRAKSLQEILEKHPKPIFQRTRLRPSEAG